MGIGSNDFLLVGIVTTGKNLIMNFNLTSSSIPYLLFYTFGVLAAIFVILMVYTGRREGHLI